MLIICQIDWREVGVAFELQCLRICTLSSFLPNTSAKPDALHGCSQDLMSRNPGPETETLYLQDRDETETLNHQDRDETKTFDFSKLSRSRRSTREQMFQKRLDTALRPRRSRPRLHPCYLLIGSRIRLSIGTNISDLE